MKSSLQVLGSLAVCGLVFNMVAIPIYHEGLFFNRDTLWPVGGIILAMFLLFFIFNISAVVWVSYRLLRQEESLSWDSLALIWGILCIILFMAEKVMIDEIARETRFGMETFGEWIILYLMLTIQLLSGSFIVFKLFRSSSTALLERP